MSSYFNILSCLSKLLIAVISKMIVGNPIKTCFTEYRLGKREQIGLYGRVLFYVVVFRRESGNQPEVGPVVAVTLDVTATKNGSN